MNILVIRSAALVFNQTLQSLKQEFPDSRITVLAPASMEQAVRLAASAVVAGDCVLLSPACASFDMFSGYAERGSVFSTAVKALQGGSL